MEIQNGFNIRYRGPLFDEHCIRVDDLCPSLSGLQQIANVTIKEFCGRDAKISLYACVPKEGSWDQTFKAIAYGTVINQLDVFTAHHPEVATQTLIGTFFLILVHIVLEKAFTPEHIKEYTKFAKKVGIPFSEAIFLSLQRLSQHKIVKRNVYQFIAPYKSSNSEENEIILGVAEAELPRISNSNIQIALKELDIEDESIEIHQFDRQEMSPQDASLIGEARWKMQFTDDYDDSIIAVVTISDQIFLNFMAIEKPDISGKTKITADLESQLTRRDHSRDTKKWYVTKVYLVRNDGAIIFASEQ